MALQTSKVDGCLTVAWPEGVSAEVYATLVAAFDTGASDGYSDGYGSWNQAEEVNKSPDYPTDLEIEAYHLGYGVGYANGAMDE